VHDHDHGTQIVRSAAGAHRGRLALVLAMVLVLLGVEVTVALATGSLALLSDAGHLATDVLGLGLALGAVTAAASRPPTRTTSFGWYRLEILAALANAALLLGIAVVVLIGAIRRFGSPVEVEAGPLLVVASVALAVNVLSAWLLRPGAEASLNLQGARLEVLADAVGSIGVLVVAVVIRTTGWHTIDSLVALAIAGWLLPRALRLGGRALRVLLQHAPAGADLERLETGLAAIDGVTDVHDLHVWTLTSGMDVASVHLTVADPTVAHSARHAAHDLLVEHAGIDHATVQVELLDDPACCEGHPTSW
jgi:cobalt-zinc-cadmium efflux system protein